MSSCLKSSSSGSAVFDLAGKKKEIIKLEKEKTEPNFWQKNNLALLERLSQIKEELAFFQAFKNELTDLKELAGLLKSSSSEGEEFLSQTAKLSQQLSQQALQFLLSGPYDKNHALLFIRAGAGGRDAQDWAQLLLKMYQAYCQKKGWPCQIIHQSFGEGGGPEGRLGLREAIMEVKGDRAYGLLKRESGAHRLVRLSPFSSKKLRHTSFCSVEVLPLFKENDFSAVELNPADLKIETFRASGPGGQYVNKRETAVRITHLPTGLQASCQSERLQGVNKKHALAILKGKIVVFKEKQRERELAQAKGLVVPDFGHQARSYVFHPYQLVKDHRSHFQTSDLAAVLGGGLDQFIIEELKVI